jgi:DNA-directed RNA polymerase specialized sigma subunit
MSISSTRSVRPRDDETLVEIARTYNVSHMTISRLKAQHGAA